jgi:dihydrofolate synthase
VIGGPFSADIEQIIRDRAFLTQSPVISACDTGIKSITKCIGWVNGKPYQSCEISINISNNMPLVS